MLLNSTSLTHVQNVYKIPRNAASQLYSFLVYDESVCKLFFGKEAKKKREMGQCWPTVIVFAALLRVAC